MEYTTLGETDLEVSRICFGTWQFGGEWGTIDEDEAARLDEEWHQKRFDHPAGLTGLWYVQTDSQSSLDDVLVIDAYYAATRTWRDDLAILWQTPAAWLRRRRVAWRALMQPATYHRQTDEVNS